MSNLTPKSIVDKNGKHTTVNVNPDKGVSAGTAERVNSITPTAPVIAPTDIESYDFVSETDAFYKKEHFDVREVAEIFETYANELKSYVDQFDVEEPSDILLDEDDDDDFVTMAREAEKWSDALEELVFSSAPYAPEGTSVSEWADYVREIGEAWKAIGNANAVTLTNDDAMEEYVEEFARECGDIPSDTPSYITNNINWGAIADMCRRECLSMELDGTTFYLT